MCSVFIKQFFSHRVDIFAGEVRLVRFQECDTLKPLSY